LILDCDAIYHQLLKTDKSLLNALENRFPGTVTASELDRKKLGSIVFADPTALADLNRITHAAVKTKILQALEEHPPLAAIDAIALHEGGLAELCDVTVAVTAPEKARIARLMEREGITEDYAKARIHAQHDDAWYQEACSHTLENSGSLGEFEGKCLAFLESLGIMKENT
jgi:dephospho-CoA kinase